MIEALQRSYLISERAPLKTLDNATKETTPFNQIFGGYMRQDVTCLRCKYVSTTFQHFMDLLLDIRQVSTIEDALQQHFRQERIGGHGDNPDSMYKCEKCHVKVPAKKRSLIERPPAVLCIQLKRFSLMGGKISKPVQLSRTLNMTPFINPGNGSGCEYQYRLVSMITHVGPSPNCGHYTAIGEAAKDQFFQFDDSSVRPISIGQVMNTASYVVFYEMSKPSWDRRLNPGSATLPANPHATSTVTSASVMQHQNGIKPVPSQTPQISFKPKIISFSTPVVNRLGVVASTLKKTVTSVATSVAGSSLVTSNGSVVKKTTGLVPYEDDSDSEIGSTVNGKSLESVSAVSQLKPMIRPALTSPFVPRAVTVNVIKKDQEQKQVLPPIISTASHPRPPPSLSPSTEASEKLKTSSGTWTVTDVDHHNPSVASDGSCGSTSGTWIVMPVAASPMKKQSNDAIKSTSPWTVMPNDAKSNIDKIDKDESGSENNSISVMPTGSKLVREPFVPPILARKRLSVDDSDNDDYDAELDRGRTKKVRKAITAPSSSPSDRGSTFNGQSERNNPFQFAQNQSYHKRNGDRADSDGGRKSWGGGQHRDHSRGRNFDSQGRRKSFGGTDFRDTYHHHHGHHGGGGGGRHHDRYRSKPDFRRSFSNGRRNDYDNRKDFRSSNR